MDSFEPPKKFDQEEFESWKDKQGERSQGKKGNFLTYLFEVPIWLVTFIMYDMWSNSSGMGEMMDSANDIQDTLHWQSVVLFFCLILAVVLIYFFIKNYT